MALDTETLRTKEFRRILLIKLSAVGDVVHTIPVLNKLRRRYPNARIDWLVTPAIGELLRHHRSISNVLLFERDRWSAPWSMLTDLARLAAELRSCDYDLVVDMHGQFRTAVLALATDAPVRIGFPPPRRRVWAASSRTFPANARKHAWKGAREGSWLAYTHWIPVPTLDLHAVDRYLGVGPMLGLDRDAADFSFPIPAAARERIEGLIRHAPGRPSAGVLTISPGTVWETKHWRGEGFAEVARHFLDKGFAVVLAGSKREREVCEAVAREAPGCLNLAGETTLSELAALIAHSSLCVTNDSGPMHLAVALGRPVVSIFGPTDEIWIGPYGQPNAVVRAALPCAPCYLRVLSRCPHDHACMHQVSAAAVIRRAETMLQMSEIGGAAREALFPWLEKQPVVNMGGADPR
jgi:lipopolysaccharide heptosyltransferase I